MAKALHPKLIGGGGMLFFFALGAAGGITSLLTSDKSIFERGIRDCAMFLVHAAIGLQLGLSY